ncbi:MAG: acetate--CoA ligase family protein [Gemmatimonadota bacterium]|nr:MAG: acetate--CoA ligase family protein [Gemmatimonadota bacterium]
MGGCTNRDEPKIMKTFFSPRSVAVVGASTRPDSVGRAIFSNLLFSGYTGIVYPVNPKAHGILGVRAYHSVWDIPGGVDLAVIIVPSTAVPGVLEECGEKGVKGAVVITAGFKEVGQQGLELERQVKDVTTKCGISLIGPNCLGIINTDPEFSLNATFARSMPRVGNIAFISQSGALGVAALEYAHEQNIGLSKFVSMGNKADVTENDLLTGLKDDPQTDVILLYLEDLSDPKTFIEQAKQITGDAQHKKPILAIKSGRTAEGAKAASSHTGALASSDEAYDAVFIESGVLRVETLEELFDYAQAFASQPLPKSNRIAIVTNAGGPGIMATDACIRYGLKLAEFEEETTDKLRTGLPRTANINNPVDIIGDAKEDRYELALRSVLEDENVDGVIAISTPQMMTDLEAVAKTIVDTASTYEKPMLTCFMATEDISETLRILDEKRVPHYLFPEAAARAMANMAEYAWWIQRPRTDVRTFNDIHKDQAKRVLHRVKKEGRSFLPEPEAHDVLEAYGFPVLESRLVKSVEEGVTAAERIGFPVVLKIVSPDIVHKVDVGGVKVNIQTKAELRRAYKDLLENVKREKPDADIWGVFVQKMAAKGKEAIIGMNRDPHFGPILLFGLGGIYVELFKDVSFRIAPLRELGARRMIRQIRGYKMFEGFRGEPPSDTEAIAECLQRLSQLVMDCEEIDELDINPLIVYNKGDGAMVVDARILIR